MVNDSSNHHHHHSAEMSFRIKQDSRFFSRLMSKETSSANSSSRVFYYGEKSVAAVPFLWEEQPGTPKHPLSETSLPPLTPPPSYYSNSKSGVNRRNSRASAISSVLMRFAGSRKSLVSPSSSWSPDSSVSSSSSSWSLPFSSSPSFSGSRSPSSSAPLKHKRSNGFRGCYPFGNS
ncbi:uncharacterized protein LOC130723941 [Lotus japonicus]|uniref:uncharacterized protein LOC130723941 n=1 Tax=Lotus japonicus TaxID=34305 RepID=UPI002590DC8E|nr:uncharacterized protein LOC130723941 [Lotus japonicus]